MYLWDINKMKNNNVFYTLKLGLFIFKRSETIINFRYFDQSYEVFESNKIIFMVNFL